MEIEPQGAEASSPRSEVEVVRAASRFTSVFTRWLGVNACEGQNFIRLEILQLLVDEGDAKMGDLAAKVSITPRNMTAIIDAMSLSGLVERVPHPDDRRATLVHVSPAGRAFICEMMERGVSDLGRGFDVLDAEAQQTLSELLARVTDEIEQRMRCGTREVVQDQEAADAIRPEGRARYGGGSGFRRL
ncbi:MAG: MarR family winged helix-turn-helix transcriptional regulator [Acidimicrobiales bacterium]